MFSQRVDQARVGRPPSHVAGTFIEITIDKVDVGQSKVGQSGASDIGGNIIADFLQLFDRLARVVAHLVGDGSGLVRQGFHFTRHYRKRLAGFACS